MIERYYCDHWCKIAIVVLLSFLPVSSTYAQFEFADLPTEDFPTGNVHWVYDSSFVVLLKNPRQKGVKQKRIKNQNAAKEELQWRTILITELNEARAMVSVMAKDANSPSVDFRHLFFLGPNNRRDSVQVFNYLDSFSSVTRFQFDSKGRRIAAGKYDASDSLIAMSAWQYDSADRVIGLAETGKDPSSLYEYRGEYDAHGNLITTYEKSYFGEMIERRSYDSLNQLITISVFVNGKQVSMDTYQYDSNGNKILETSYVRQENPSGSDTAVVDHTKRMMYDSRKNLVQLIYTDSQEEEPREVHYTYTYDANDNWKIRRMLTKANGITETIVTYRTILYYP